MSKVIINFILAKLRLGRYRSSIAQNYKKQLRKIESVKNHIQYFQVSSNIFLHEFSQSFSICSKNGGYKKFIGHWIWVNQKIMYFPTNQKKIINFGGVPNFITEADLVCATNAEIFPNKFENNYRQKYTFHITENKSENIDLEEAITFNVGGANLFQHFLQDCLPIIAMSKKFLAKNPTIPMLLPESNLNFETRDYFLKKMGISNKIIETNLIESLKIKYLYFWNFYPFNAQYCLPPIFYKEMRGLIRNQNFFYKKRSIVLFIRIEKMRNFKNLEHLKKVLEKFAVLNNLDLEIVNTSSVEISKLNSKMKRALVVIGIHGGSMYNAILCQDDCTVIEFVPIKNTNSTINFLSFSGIKYLPIPGHFDFYDETVEVSISDLMSALSTINFNELVSSTT